MLIWETPPPPSGEDAYEKVVKVHNVIVENCDLIPHVGVFPSETGSPSDGMLNCLWLKHAVLVLKSVCEFSNRVKKRHV